MTAGEVQQAVKDILKTEYGQYLMRVTKEK
jgi:phage baseplate assembly protein W